MSAEDLVERAWQRVAAAVALELTPLRANRPWSAQTQKALRSYEWAKTAARNAKKEWAA